MSNISPDLIDKVISSMRTATAQDQARERAEAEGDLFIKDALRAMADAGYDLGNLQVLRRLLAAETELLRKTLPYADEQAVRRLGMWAKDSIDQITESRNKTTKQSDTPWNRQPST